MEQANALAAAMAQNARDIAEGGRNVPFGQWLQPIVAANDLGPSSPEASSYTSAPAPASTRRGRGRPRVNKPRDQSTIEVRPAVADGASLLCMRSQ
jgi:hypothetical protein